MTHHRTKTRARALLITSACLACGDFPDDAPIPSELGSELGTTTQALVAATAEFPFGPNTGWRWFTNVSSSRLAQEIDQGYRIASLDVIDGDPLRFDAVLVPNSGPYGQAWWWWPSLTASEIEDRLDDHQARLTQLEPFINASGARRYAVAMVRNTGADALPWSWFPSITWADLQAHRDRTGDRIIDIESFEQGGERRYSAITDASDLGGRTAMLSHSQVSGIEAWLANNPRYSVIDWERRALGGYVALAAEQPATPHHWRYYGITASQVSYLAGRHYARAVDVESYVSGGERRYDVMLRDNGQPSQGASASFGGAATIAQRISNFMKQRGIPGLGVALVKDGRLIYTKGYGLARVNGSNEAATPETKFRIGSCSKVFASAALMRLIDARTRLSNGTTLTRNTRIFRDILRPALGAPLGTYDSWYDGITVDQILHHTSGLDDQSPRVNPITHTRAIARDLGIRRTPTCSETVRWMLDKAEQLTPSAGLPTPGSLYEYYNTGPCIAAAAVEALTPEDSFEEHLRQQLLTDGLQNHIVPSSDLFALRAPLEAEHSSSIADILSGSEMVVPRYLELATSWQNGLPLFSADVKAPYGGVPLVNGTAPGGLAASVVGLARFLTLLDGSGPRRLVSNAAWTDMTTGSTPNANYGMYLSLNTANGDVYHNGAVAGGFAWFVRKADGALWVVAANSSDSDGTSGALNALMIDAYAATRADFDRSTGDLFARYGL